MKKNKITKVALSSALALVLIGTADKVVASDWHANSIETIVENVKGDQEKYNKKEYDIRWGDYLFGISKATGVNLDTLAQINNIANKDLIIAGNKLYYGTDSNLVTKDNNGDTKVYQEKRYDGSNKVAEVPKTSLTGKEEKAIKDKNPGVAKDFNDDKKVNDKIIKDNKDQIKDLDKGIKIVKADADKKVKEQEDIKKDLKAQKDKLVKEDKDKNKDEIAKIDEKIKEADKKIEDIKKEADKKVDEKEKQKDYLKTENEKLEADKKGDKKTSDEKQKELDDKKENDPYEIWKKEQLKKNPKLKEKDLTREQYEISKKDKKDEGKKEEKPDTPQKDEGDKKDDGKDKTVEPKEDPKEEKPSTGKDDKKEDKPSEDTGKKDDGKKEETKVITEKVPFKTVRKYNDPNLKTKVDPNNPGVEGLKVTVVKYDKNGNEVSREVDGKQSYAPKDRVILSYVKVQDAKYETREVEDKSKPIYDDVIIYRAFVNEFIGVPDSVKQKQKELKKRQYDPDITAEESMDIQNQSAALVEPYRVQTVFESDESDPRGAYRQASEYAGRSRDASNYGDLDPRVEHKLIGYEKTTQNVKVQDELWDWE